MWQKVNFQKKCWQCKVTLFVFKDQRINIFIFLDLSRPMVKYVANIHGDEAVTRELLLGLAQHLVWNYGKDQRVTQLLNKTEVEEHKPVFRRELYCLCNV